jgi:signal transduction histidine kinase
VPAIDWLAQDFSQRWQIDCSLHVYSEDIQVDEKYATHLFRIIQESLTNVARHASAFAICIKLEQLPDAIYLEINDDGCGFTLDNHTRGFGLIGIRERVQELGGTLRIETTLTLGTRIIINIPNAGDNMNRNIA